MMWQRAYGTILGLALAAGGTGLIVFLRAGPVGDWFSQTPLLPFILTVMAAAYVGGFWPGIAATALGTVAGQLLPAPTPVPESVRIVGFLIIGVALSALAG